MWAYLRRPVGEGGRIRRDRAADLEAERLAENLLQKDRNAQMLSAVSIRRVIACIREQHFTYQLEARVSLGHLPVSLAQRQQEVRLEGRNHG